RDTQFDLSSDSDSADSVSHSDSDLLSEEEGGHESGSSSDEEGEHERVDEKKEGGSFNSGEDEREDELERELNTLTVPVLKSRLREKELKVGGRKSELIDRLMGKHQKNSNAATIDSETETEACIRSLTTAVLKERLKKKGLKLGGSKAELIDRLMGREKPKVIEWNKSDGKRLLIKLIHDDKSWVHRMTPEEIHQSNPLFANYPFPKFKEYLKCIQSTMATQKEIVRVNEQEIWQEELAFPRENTTDRGYPFWDTHAARGLLQEDVGDGRADEMTPKELQKTRTEYMIFPLHVFRSHIYQEKRRKREEPGWVHKRNKKGQKMHENEVNALKDDWDTQQQQHRAEEINTMCQRWESLRMQDEILGGENGDC
ncbi:hypothetical protein ACHAXR_001251, partial [Thalassiosira sp. AJA248-18]